MRLNFKKPLTLRNAAGANSSRRKRSKVLSEELVFQAYLGEQGIETCRLLLEQLGETLGISVIAVPTQIGYQLFPGGRLNHLGKDVVPVVYLGGSKSRGTEESPPVREHHIGSLLCEALDIRQEGKCLLGTDTQDPEVFGFMLLEDFRQTYNRGFGMTSEHGGYYGTAGFWIDDEVHARRIDTVKIGELEENEMVVVAEGRTDGDRHTGRIGFDSVEKVLYGLPRGIGLYGDGYPFCLQ